MNSPSYDKNNMGKLFQIYSYLKIEGINDIQVEEGKLEKPLMIDNKKFDIVEIDWECFPLIQKYSYPLKCTFIC